MEAARQEFQINRKGERQIAIAIGVSLLVHLLLLLIPWGLELWHRSRPAPEKLTWIQMTPPQNAREKRIVQTETAEKSDAAPDKAFFGAQNQKADRETVSRDRQIQAPGSPPMSAKRAQRESESPLAKFGIPLVEPKASAVPPTSEAMAPSQRAFDYVPGVKEGERSVLNTKEFVFYGYFQRIRRRLDQAWIPLLREKLMKLYRSGRQLASDMDHTTRVLVVLSAQGEITKVLVLGESGSEELDEAAVKAFNKAGPFPNPPRGLVDVDGEVKIPWDFILSTK